MTLILDPHPSMAIAAELETILKAESYDDLIGPYNVTLVVVPELALIDLQSRSQILVAARGLDSSPSSRHSTNEQPSVDICIRTKCEATNVERVQLFLSFAWSLRRYLLGLGDIADWPIRNVTGSPIYDVDTLRSINELRINQSFQFNAIMEHG